MQSKWMIPIVVAALMSVTACGTRSETKSETHQVIQDSPTPVPNPIYKIGGMSAEDFYRQFMFQVEGSCGERPVFYRFTKSQTIRVAVNSWGQDVLAELSVLMYSDHSYKALYREMDVIEYTATGYYWKTNRDRILDGTWQVIEDKLDLSGLGIASGIPNFRAMRLAMNTDLITRGLANHTLQLQYVEGNYEPVPGADPCQ